jgi:hypothetical protein
LAGVAASQGGRQLHRGIVEEGDYPEVSVFSDSDVADLYSLPGLSLSGGVGAPATTEVTPPQEYYAAPDKELPPLVGTADATPDDKQIMASLKTFPMRIQFISSVINHFQRTEGGPAEAHHLLKRMGLVYKGGGLLNDTYESVRDHLGSHWKKYAAAAAGAAVLAKVGTRAVDEWQHPGRPGNVIDVRFIAGNPWLRRNLPRLGSFLQDPLSLVRTAPPSPIGGGLNQQRVVGGSLNGREKAMSVDDLKQTRDRIKHMIHRFASWTRKVDLDTVKVNELTSYRVKVLLMKYRNVQAAIRNRERRGRTEAYLTA